MSIRKSKEQQKFCSVLDFDSEEELLNSLQVINFHSTTLSQEAQVTLDLKYPARYDHALPDKSSLDVSNDIQRSHIENEAKRLLALKAFSVLESPSEDDFNRLTVEIRDLFQVPCACLTFVDYNRKWFKAFEYYPSSNAPTINFSSTSPQLSETSRRDTFCAHTILEKDGFLVVPDALQDDRFRNNSLTNIIHGGLQVRFYAGAALVAPDGFRIGTLCVVDSKPRPQGVSDIERQGLQAQAAVAVQLLLQRKERFDEEVSKALIAPSPITKRVSVDASTGQTSAEILSAIDGKEDLSTSAQVRALTPLTPNPGRKKKARSKEEWSPSNEMANTSVIIPRPLEDSMLPDPNVSGVDPDQYLSGLIQTIWGITLKIKPALDLKDYFEVITEKQMAAYNVEVVCLTRENNADKLREFFRAHGRDGLDCFNRFGEGLLNMACRRGFKEIVRLLLSDEVNLSVRVRDDFGRTPLHDACWHPEPQLEICSWIMAKDPSLFLISDKRGYTPFQYARKSDWQIWRQFLFDNRHHLQALANHSTTAIFA